jgi:plasmid stability protein
LIPSPQPPHQQPTRLQPDFLIELAVAGGTRAIVTHNVRDLRRSELRWSNFKAPTPAECLETLKMSTLTIRLPDDTARRLKQLAATRGVNLNEPIEELGTAALAAYDVENRFKAMAARANREAALQVLARLDRDDLAHEQ